MVQIERTWGLADIARAYKVIVDGEEFTTIRNGKTIDLDLPIGEHEIYFKIDSCRSDKLFINITSKEQNKKIECYPVFRGLLFSIFYMIFNPSKYITTKVL